MLTLGIYRRVGVLEFFGPLSCNANSLRKVPGAGTAAETCWYFPQLNLYSLIMVYELEPGPEWTTESNLQVASHACDSECYGC